MDSHIQMPKFMLKRFVNAKHELFYYDVVTKVLGIGYPKSINTEEDYYSDGMETILNREIETPFSKVLQYIDAIDFDSDSFNLFPGYEKAVKLFLRALFVRNPNNVDDINNNSVFFQFYDTQSQHDAAVLIGMEEVNSQALFDEFFPTFSVNRSDIPFVLPICGFYGFKHNGIKHINLPMDPWTAITLIEKSKVDSIIKDDMVRLYLITEDKKTEMFNRLAFENQKRQKYGRLVANERKVLECFVEQESESRKE